MCEKWRRVLINYARTASDYVRALIYIYESKRATNHVAVISFCFFHADAVINSARP